AASRRPKIATAMPIAPIDASAGNPKESRRAARRRASEKSAYHKTIARNPLSVRFVRGVVGKDAGEGGRRTALRAGGCGIVFDAIQHDVQMALGLQRLAAPEWAEVDRAVVGAEE